MSSDNTVDGLLMTLVGMGFDLDRSQEAVQAGKYNLQDAIEWLLQCNNTNVIPTISTPTLNLRQDRQAPVSQTQNISMQVDSGFNVSPASSESKVVEAEAKPTQTLSSRYALNEEQLADKDRWEQEQRDQVAREAKEKRLMKKKERQQILQEIEADKKARMKKIAATSGSSSSTTQEVLKGSDVTLNEGFNKEQLKEKTEKKELMCTLQIRLPSGQALRHEFEASCHLQSVVEFVKEQEPALQEIELLQTFPRHVYTCEDMTHSLSELKLTPRGVLVARKSEGPPSKVHRPEAEGSSATTSSPATTPSVSSSVSTSTTSSSVHNLSGVDVAGRLNRQMQLIADQRPPPRGHNWGAGHSLQQPDQEQPEPLAPGNVEIAVDEEMPADNDINELIAGWGQAQGQVGHQHPWGGGNRLDAGPLNFVYGFQEGGRGRQEGVEEVSNQKAAEAALKRIELAHQQPRDHPTTSMRAANIPSLVDITTKAVAKKLGDPSQSPASLGGVPQQLAVRIIDEMKKEGTLRPRTMHIFLSCHLTHCVLDCYSYATNELLHALRFHNNIHHLSLCSCSLISDAGLTILLPGLKKLKTLKLNLNPQITDKVLEYITDLKQLTAIGLEGANITDRGVENLACLSSSLTHVNLSKTRITDASISILANLSQLRYLAIEQTQVTNLLPLQCLSNLESLNIGFTCAGSDSLVGLQKLPNLKGLNLSCIHSMEGDAALACLTGMQLRHIQLPSRHTTTDSGLQCIAGMALVELDLSDYINITDDGIHHLADMTSLRKLSLSNTKTTDVGLAYLQGLTELQGLTLDRTNVTDKGVVLLGCLTKLSMLSLSSTLITSKVLKSGALNRCHMLNKLNLSRSKVSNSGLAHLKLPNLTLLNLDYTFVTLSAANSIKHCPNLKVVRANNLRVRPIDEASDSD
ncbi:uncharacterized protein LOC117101993 [Anneissia japonica]|uniref:uncharacterized protein LOC117101993 n=1 Tax=Anneissia japonica TaxID=1529436 RepID=UPI001425B12B|nr:uncharacterized protein LOC117101993 [Anneissia japonica]